jgi:hypothetical protein
MLPSAGKRGFEMKSVADAMNGEMRFRPGSVKGSSALGLNHLIARSSKPILRTHQITFFRSARELLTPVISKVQHSRLPELRTRSDARPMDC